MKKKEKKKQKKKDKALRHSAGESQSSLKTLAKTVKRLEKELRVRDAVIQDLNRRLDVGPGTGKTKPEPETRKPKAGSEPRQKSRKTGVAVAQRKAWKQHSFLRDRYEHHLGAGRDKNEARLLANLDLRAEFGQETGYTEQELQHILS